MKYYVTADVHGYFSELKVALTEKGYFEDNDPHKLVICGDLYDRGAEACKLQEFVLGLMEKDEVILIKGNHEDLAMDLLCNWSKGSYLQYHHQANGTIDTVCQLTRRGIGDLHVSPEEMGREFLENPYVQNIIPAMVDYYETEHYIFTHGWIPCHCIVLNPQIRNYFPVEDWRDASAELWEKARYINGMEAAYSGVTEKQKTIVCGHWHCSFGHARYEGNGGEFDNNPNFKPYYAEGIIALDACTPISKQINCIVIED